MSAPHEEARDRAFMRRALSLARRGWGWTAPNPMVGAVVVRDGRIVGEGFHERFGAPHAEAVALAQAGDAARGATLYVSLEPCAHHGKTPPCADAVIAAGVTRVVIATRDPHPDAAGGVERMRHTGVRVDVGLLERQARELNAPFFHAIATPSRPWITLKLALSLDGALADATGGARWITGPRARRAAHVLRAGSDAVAVGIGTALADDPLLTVRGVRRPRRAPLRVVFDRQARLPLGSQLARSAARHPTAVITADPPPPQATALEREGVTIVAAADLHGALRALRQMDIRSLLVEGGAALATALLAGAVVDRLIIFHGGTVLGRGAVHPWSALPVDSVDAAPRFHILSHRRMGDDLMTTYAPGDAECSPA